MRYPIIRDIVNSKYLDVFGALLVFGITIYKNFHTTMYIDGDIQFNVPINQILNKTLQGGYPLGILSTIGAVFSILSTRLIGKQNNWGNGIGVVTTVNSGINDFLFGNRSALITYPLSFIINAFCTYNWTRSIKLRDRDKWYWMIIAGGMIIGYGLVYLGFQLFGGLDSDIFFHTVAVTFGLSIGANVATAFKYKETWLSWVIYNIVQLIKNSIQANLANVVKYIFYLFNAAVTLTDWRVNGDQGK